MPNEGNDASRAGTAEHQASAECLEHGFDPWSYLGRVMVFDAHGEHWQRDASDQGDHRVTLDEAAIQRIEAYVRFVLELTETSGGVLLVEQRVPIDFITGEGHWQLSGVEVPEGTPGAEWKPAGGTSDGILLTDDELIIIDAKFGQKRVPAWDMVSAATLDPITGQEIAPVFAPNKQLAMYAAGSLREFGWMAPGIKRVRMIIVQPKLSAVSEHVVTVEELHAFIDTLRAAAEETRTNPTYRPSEDACGFCRARLTCKAREEFVLSSVLDGFVEGDVQALFDATPKRIDGNWLGVLYEKLDLLQGFIKDVHTRVFHALMREEPVIGASGEAYKLVEGRPGHRKWTDPAAVEATLKVLAGLPDEQIYNRKLISPADAETLATAKRAWRGRPAIPATLPADKWEALQGYITQDKGQASIVPASDARPAMKPATGGFTDFQPPVESDLFS